MIRLAIKASGMVTAVGFNARSTCAAIRAGISGAEKDGIGDIETGERISAARPRMPQWWPGPDMLAELAAPAIAECLAVLPDQGARARVPILVLLSPADRPCREPELGKIVLAGIQDRLQAVAAGGMTAYAAGRTGIFPALHRAAELISTRDATHAIIVGVDSFLRQPVAEAYMEERRILTPANSNGFIPGEAACAVLVTTASEQADSGLQVVGWGEGRERGTITSEEPLSGNGLTQAIRAALTMAGIEWKQTHYWLTDQNAEHYKAKECTIAQTRLERRLKPAERPFEIWHPIEYLGEIGSAIGPCLLGLGLAAGRGGYAPGPLALMSISEDNEERAAFVLQYHSKN